MVPLIFVPLEQRDVLGVAAYGDVFTESSGQAAAVPCGKC